MKTTCIFFLVLAQWAALEAATIGSGYNITADLISSNAVAIGPLLSTSSSTNGPAANELATAGWIRNLLVTGQILYNSGETNSSGFDSSTFAYVATIPTNGSRTYLSASCTNNAYIGSVMTTNLYTSIGGDLVVSPYICSINGTPSSGYTLHAEVYLTYDRTNIFGDYESGIETIYHGVTNKYSFVVPVPQYTSTNSTGFYIVRRLKINAKTGSDDIILHYGTNFPSSISIPGNNLVQYNSTNINTIVLGGANTTVSSNTTSGVTTYTVSTTAASSPSSAFIKRIWGWFIGNAATVSYIGTPETAAGLGTGVIVRQNATATIPSMLLLGTGLTTNSYYIISDNNNDWVPTKASTIVFRFGLSNVANLRCGLGVKSVISSIVTENPRSVKRPGAYFIYSSESSTNWFLETSNGGGVDTLTDTLVSADTNMHTFKMDMNSTSVIGYIDGTPVATNVSNINTSTAIQTAIGILNFDTESKVLKFLQMYGEQDW